MERMEDQGAIHTIWTMVTPFIGAICNCTLRDCLAMRTLSSIHVETMARAEYVATVDEGTCTGCGVCEGACQFDAIGSRRESSVIRAQINSNKCYGCGLCRKACDAGAISLIQR
jgi:heterodisulfide reductase subunit A-like polyferredoxin